MNEKILIAVYLIIVVAILLINVANKKKSVAYYESLDKKEHPLKTFYPAGGYVFGKISKITGRGASEKVAGTMKRLCVKENVSEEVFLYCVKKYTTIICVLLAACILGFLLTVSQQSADYIKTLERNGYGQGEANYTLNVHYKGNDETVEIGIDELQYTEKEAKKKFEDSFEAVKKEMLGENKSVDHVDKPLNLISSYEDIEIEWEIEDTKIIDYSGEISEDLSGKDQILMNLYATFSLGDVKEVYQIPVSVSGETKTKTEKLVEQIKKSIEKDNSIYEEEVVLPDKLGNEEISFSETKDDNGAMFLILGLLAVVLIAFTYDQNLEKQVKKRKEQMLIDFTEIVSKLSLLYEAGMSMLMAWEKVVSDQETKHAGDMHFAYQEMKLALEKIRSGTSEKEAYAEFGRRCGLHPYIKLGNILEQNLTKGTKGMKTLLKQEVTDAFEERKRIAKKQGEEASTKLLFPMMIMLVVVIIIIAVPALMTIQI